MDALEEAVARAGETVTRVQALVVQDPAFLPVYTAAQEVYTAAQVNLRTAMSLSRSVSSGGVLTGGCRSGWTSKGVRASKLKELFEGRLQDARTYRRSSTRDPTGPFELDAEGKLPLDDIGDYFPLVGRDEAMLGLMRANWHVYQYFRRRNLKWDYFRRKEHVLGVIAYPGAGKTTLGKTQSQALREGWQKISREQRLLELGEAFNRDARDPCLLEWDEMMDRVACSSYDLLMCHDLVVSAGGGPLYAEQGLDVSQLFALRTLHAALSRADEDTQDPQTSSYEYSDLLTDLDSLASGLKQHLVFDDVVDFIRQGCGFGKGKRIFLSFFFDEINVASGAPSFVQSIFQEYIRWLFRNRCGDTFVTMVAATNVFNAASLRSTGDTGWSKVIPIPVRPLSMDERKSLAAQFIKRLQLAAGDIEPKAITKEMELLLTLSGGNPRLISFIFQAYISTDSGPVLLQQFLDALTGSVNRQYFRQILERTWSLTSPNYYNGFKSTTEYPCILRAIQASLLRHKVERSERVVPHLDNTWDRLEETGLVAALPVEGEFGYIRAEFSPLFLHHLLLQREDHFCQVLPDPSTMTSDNSSDNWSQKEDNNLLGVLFSIFLKKELLKFGGGSAFTLQQILPANWKIPEKLQGRSFKFPDFPVRVKQSSPSCKGDITGAGTWAFCGPRNNGSDTIVVLTEILQVQIEKMFLLFIESNCCGNPVTVPSANWNAVVAPKVKAIEALVNIEGDRKETQTRFGIEQFGLLFLSDMNNADEHFNYFESGV